MVSFVTHAQPLSLVMIARRKKSRIFSVFSSYSLLLHLTGFITLAILIGTPTTKELPLSSSLPIMVRLMETTPKRSKIQTASPVMVPQRAAPMVSPQEQQSILIPAPTALFHVLPLPDQSLPPSRENVFRKDSPGSPFAQVTLNTLLPVRIDQTVPSMRHSSALTALASRTLKDRRAGKSLPDTTPAKILYNPEPIYPQIARENGMEGQILLRVEILQDGRPGTIQVKKSCGHTILDEAAAEAVKKWRFAPAQDGLFVIRSIVELPIRFILKS